MPPKTIDMRQRKELRRRVAEISGENVYRCMQCGTCSGVCPMADAMAITPRQAMLLLAYGMEEELAAANVGGVCASCHSCMVRCPRGIDVAKAMETLRQLLVRREQLVDPNAIPRRTMCDVPAAALVAAFRKLT